MNNTGNGSPEETLRNWNWIFLGGMNGTSPLLQINTCYSGPGGIPCGTGGGAEIRDASPRASRRARPPAHQGTSTQLPFRNVLIWTLV